MRQPKNIFLGFFVFGLAVWLLLSNISSSTAFGTAGYKGGNVTTCYNNTPGNSNVKINGHPFNGNGVLSVPASGSCAPGDTSLNLFSYARTILVSPVGTPAQNGAALLAATANYQGTAPSANGGLLIKVEPGVYDLGNQTLVMQPYEDLEGSGEGITILTSQNAAPIGGSFKATLQAANNSEVRWITLDNSSPNTADYRQGIAAALAQSVDQTARFTHVTFSSANGYGLLSSNSANPTVQDSTFNTFFGVNAGSASVTIQNSTINAVEGGITGGQATVNLDKVQIRINCLNGGVATDQSSGINGGRETVTMRNSSVSVNGCSQGGGIGIEGSYAFNGRLEYTSITVSAANPTPVEGIQIEAGASLVLQNSSVIVSGSSSDAIKASSGSITVQNTNLEAYGGNGATLNNAGNITIQNSKVLGGTNSLLATGSGDPASRGFSIGSSQLAGPVSGTANFRCVVTYKADFTQTNNVCQ